VSYPVPVSGVRAAVLCVVLLGAGCSTDYSALTKYVPKIITPYRMDIQQGNFVTQDMVDKLQAGQTRDQVKFILGTPLLTDVFHADRWDYPFRFSKGWNDPERHQLTIYFKDDKVEHWEGNVPPPKSNTLAAPEKPGFFKRVFSFGKSSEPAAATPPTAAQGAAGAPGPAPAEAQVGGAANLSVASAEPPKAAEPSPPVPAVEPPKSAEPPPPASAAVPSNIIAPQPAEPLPEKSPGIMGRLFGWMKSSGSAADASAAANRAANPDPEPQPMVLTPLPPLPPRTPAPAPAEVIPPVVSPASEPPPAAPAAVAEPPLAAPPPPEPRVIAVAPAPAAPPPPEPPVAATVPAPAASPPPEPPVIAVAPVPAVAPPAAAAPAAAAPPPVAENASPRQILDAIETWRAAWESKDAARYLAAYAPDFKLALGLSRPNWEAQRRERLEKPSFITVKVVDPKVTMGKVEAAVVVFVQQYESNLLKESARKTLKFGLYGGKWLIREETVVAQGAAVIPGLAPLVVAPGAPAPAK
jgi:outer membrane protein assembly factor BamE